MRSKRLLESIHLITLNSIDLMKFTLKIPACSYPLLRAMTKITPMTVIKNRGKSVTLLNCSFSKLWD